jgi:hypothetical protein
MILWERRLHSIFHWDIKDVSTGEQWELVGIAVIELLLSSTNHP